LGVPVCASRLCLGTIGGIDFSDIADVYPLARRTEHGWPYRRSSRDVNEHGRASIVPLVQAFRAPKAAGYQRGTFVDTFALARFADLPAVT
jgi:hypothetical protein